MYRFPRVIAICFATLFALASGACDSPLAVDTPRNEYVDRVSIPQAELIGEGVSVILPIDTSGTDTTLQRIPFSIAFVVDASGSIAVSTAAAFRNGCLAVLDSMDGIRDEGALVFYTQTATLSQGITSQLPLLRSAIGAIPTDGASAMWDGVYKAMLELQARGSHARKAVLLFSDGEDNSSTTGTPAKITTLGQSANISVYSISLRPTIHEAVLQNIVMATGGKHFSQPTLEQIDGICRETAHTLIRP
ncbi:MAG: VWA domain-containing protein [Bacteroidetes bacterium]|nr:VWA domain-containing protein [Bacteroidota bacterium]